MASYASITFRVSRSAIAGALLATLTLLATTTALARDGSGFGAPPEQAIALRELPLQGQRTYTNIFAGGPFRHDKDGSTFGNRERQLPSQPRGHYREYTVETPGSHDRGARRIVCGGAERAPQACWYTADHYASFRRIVP